MAAEVPASKPDGESSLKRRLVAIGPAVATALAALYSMVAVCNADHATASPEAWLEVASAVRGERQEGELIVFAPSWIDPVGRQYLGDQMDIDMAARMDAARYSGVWEVSLDGARAPEARGLKSDSSRRAGPLRLRHYPQVPVNVLYDFTANWREGKASGPMQGRPNLSLEEVGFEPHRCIKVVPRPDETAIVTFSNVPLGRSIVGYVGLADIFTRRDIRDPGRLAVLVDGKLGVSVTAGIDDGWKRFEVPTPGGSGDVEFRLTAVGAEARDRRICFAAEARE